MENSKDKVKWYSSVWFMFLLLGVVCIGGPLFIGFASYIAANDSGVRFETEIKAQYDQNQNVLGQYTLKVQEALGVTEVYSEDLQKVISTALASRYGEGGSRGVMQWIQESYPGQVDSKLYVKIQQIIEAGRRDFENEQKLLIDKKAIYERELGYFWSGFWLKVAGYPKIDLDKYLVVVSTDARRAYETGVDVPQISRKKTAETVE